MSPRRRPTILDIAKEIGVTPATVSNVLNGRNLENRPTAKARADRIRAVAERLGYRPNLAARSMRTTVGKSVALLTGNRRDWGGYFAPTLLTGAEAAAAEQGCRLVFASWSDEELTDPNHMSRLMIDLGVDGVLINYIVQVPPGLEEMLHRYDIPAVWVNSKRPRDCVHPDDFAAGRSMTDHLIALGHRRIAYVRYGESVHYSAQDRQAGYEAAMRAARLEPWCEIDHRTLDDAGRVALFDRLLRRSDRPTALVLYGGEHPIFALYAAARLGLQVPRDLSVVSIFDTGRTVPIERPLTSWLVPADQVGEVAVRQLLSAQGARPAIAIPLVYQPGETTARI